MPACELGRRMSQQHHDVIQELQRHDDAASNDADAMQGLPCQGGRAAGTRARLCTRRASHLPHTALNGSSPVLWAELLLHMLDSIVPFHLAWGGKHSLQVLWHIAPQPQQSTATRIRSMHAADAEVDAAAAQMSQHGAMFMTLSAAT